MAKRKSKKKDKEQTVEKLDIVPIAEENKGTVEMNNNSFAWCIEDVTKIPANLFNDIRYNLRIFGASNWYQPYIDVLRDHSYDMIFFAFRGTKLIVDDEHPIKSYKFANMPVGKCLILGNNETEFRCMVGTLDKDARLTVTYDPEPQAGFTEISQLGFFINTFIRVNDETVPR